MTEFLEVAFRLPAAFFTVLLVVVVGYWVIVMLGALGIDAFDGGDGELGAAGMLAAIGLGGVPVSVVLSLWISFAWFASFIGTAMVNFSPGFVGVLGAVVLLVGATAAAYFVTFAAVLPLRRLFPDETPPSRRDFVGLECVVRTAMDSERGQAEVIAVDGSSAIIQVRQAGDDDLAAGSTALIFDYDADGEFFWITAFRSET